MSKLNQTLLKFELEQNFAYDDFFVSKCNYFAFSLIETWPKWEKSILNVYGRNIHYTEHIIISAIMEVSHTHART